MKVEFIEVMVGKDFEFNTETVYDLPKKEANRYIEHGICIESNGDVVVDTKEKDIQISDLKKQLEEANKALVIASKVEPKK